MGNIRGPYGMTSKADWDEVSTALGRVFTSVPESAVVNVYIAKGDIDHAYFAKLAEQAERYDEMAEHMRYVGTWKEASSMCLC